MDELRERGVNVARCGATDVWVWQGDIAALDVEAVVNDDRAAVERFGGAPERELGRGDGR